MPLAFPKPISRARTRKDRARETEAHWQKVRKAVLERDGYRCRACGRRESMAVHHITFRSAGREDSTRNCATLCILCHDDIHAYRLTLHGDANGKLRIERTE